MYAPQNTIRHTTPPTFAQPQYFPGSGESRYSVPHQLYSSNEHSPDSAVTSTTSPRCSPLSATIKVNGPLLLPRIRCQDQATEPSAALQPVGHHHRNLSVGVP